MSLATRLSLFFLTALGVVLAGFSIALYLLGGTYLFRQMDARLEKALDSLQAAIHIDSDGLEWKPKEKRLAADVDPEADQMRWIVQNERGIVVDQSSNAQEGGFTSDLLGGVLPDKPKGATVVADLPNWRVARRHLRLAEELQRIGKGRPDRDDPDPDEHEELILSVGLSPTPMRAGLNQLGWAVAGVSTVLWLGCAGLGQWLCRRALKPITEMAGSARAMAATDAGGSLPNPGTHDELEDLSQAFNSLLDRRQEALERQQRFAGDASHQLRTPLAGLLSLVEVIRRRPRPVHEYEETLDQVHTETLRLRQIVESLLFLARSEAEAVPPDGQPIDLAAWVPELVTDRWAKDPRISDLHVEVEPSSRDAGVWVTAHPPLLAQVVENLIDNAIKYSERGTPVSVTVGREQGAAVIAVEDHGCGLSPEEIASIFDPFYRSPRARQMGRTGVGLGLSVVQRIVQAFRGTIAVESRPQQGARFVVRLPLDQPAPRSLSQARIVLNTKETRTRERLSRGVVYEAGNDSL